MGYTSGQIKSVLQDANKTQEGYNTWRQMYGAIDFAKQSQMSNLKYTTEKDIADTFAEAYSAKQAINNSNYFDTAKEQFSKDIDDTFAEAYANYMNNYAQGINKIETAAAEGRQAITDKLDEEAMNYKNVYDSLYDYLENLYNKTYYEPEKPASFWGDEARNWSKYLVDENGAKRLVTREELEKGIIDNSTGEYLLNPMYTITGDNQQELTTSGEDFIDQMLNDMALRGDAMSYDEWLMENNPELYDWYSNFNPYTFAPKNDAGEYTTGGSAFRQLFGLKSTDQKYEFIERFGGLSKSQLENKLSGFVDKINDAFNKSKKASEAKTSIEFIQSAVNDMKLLMRGMGIEEDVLSEFDKFDNMIENYIGDTTTGREITEKFFTDLALGTTGGGVAGASVGSVVPGAGTLIGGVVGLIAGALGGITGGAYDTVKSKKQNKKNKQMSKDAALNLVYNLMAYAENKRQSAQA